MRGGSTPPQAAACASPSGQGSVCNTLIHRFESGRALPHPHSHGGHGVAAARQTVILLAAVRSRLVTPRPGRPTAGRCSDTAATVARLHPWVASGSSSACSRAPPRHGGGHKLESHLPVHGPLAQCQSARLFDRVISGSIRHGSPWSVGPRQNAAPSTRRRGFDSLTGHPVGRTAGRRHRVLTG